MEELLQRFGSLGFRAVKRLWVLPQMANVLGVYLYLCHTNYGAVSLSAVRHPQRAVLSMSEVSTPRLMVSGPAWPPGKLTVWDKVRCA